MPIQPRDKPIDIPARIPIPGRSNPSPQPIIPTPNRGRIKQQKI